MKNSANDTHTVLHRFKNFRYGLLIQGIAVGALAGLVLSLIHIYCANRSYGDFELSSGEIYCQGLQEGENMA